MASSAAPPTHGPGPVPLTTFEAAVAYVRSLPQDGMGEDGARAPTQEEKLHLYAFFKQALTGPCNTSRPGFFDFEGRAKWDAWNAVRGMSPIEAQRQYFGMVNALRGCK